MHEAANGKGPTDGSLTRLRRSAIGAAGPSASGSRTATPKCQLQRPSAFARSRAATQALQRLGLHRYAEHQQRGLRGWCQSRSTPSCSKEVRLQPSGPPRVTLDVPDPLATLLNSVSRKDESCAARTRFQQLLASGYSFERIAALLREGGLSISGQTVRNYWRQAQREARNGKKRGSSQNQRPAQQSSSAPSMSDTTKRRSPDLGATTARSADESEPDRDRTISETPANNSRRGHFSVIPDSKKL